MTNLLIKVIAFLMRVYDLITLPLYWVSQEPWKRIERLAQYKTVIERVSDTKIKLTSNENCITSKTSSLVMDGELTLPALVDRVCQKYASFKCMGYREVFGYVDGVFNGMPVKKVIRSESYKYLSYEEVKSKTVALANGLYTKFNLKPRDRVLIFANTRVEWTLAGIAVLQTGCIISTLAPTMTDESTIHGLKKIKPVVIITESERICKLKTLCAGILEDLVIVSMDNVDKSVHGNVLTLTDLEIEGQNLNCSFPPMKPDDPALIMFTSGTTSSPKGVILSHMNVIATVNSLSLRADNQRQFDTGTNFSYLCYLPTSHIYEFAHQYLHMSYGACLHFGSPKTLTDQSPAVVPGQKGDLTTAKPFYLIAVPLVLNKIKAAVDSKIAEKGPLFHGLFLHCLQYKIEWMKRGYQTPILDTLVFRRTREVVGGNLGLVIAGGAAVSPDVQQFARAALCTSIVQGFSATESTMSGIVQDLWTCNTEDTGFPYPTVQIMMETWEDGGYFVNNPKEPAGELLVGGKTIAMGYFEHDDPYDNVAFFEDDDGTRWFRTGDVAKLNLETTFVTIIDRKRQVVKLSNGEKVCLGKIDGVLSGSKYVESCCVLWRAGFDRLVAIVVPNLTPCEQLLLEKKAKKEELEKVLLDQLHTDFKGILLPYEIPGTITLVMGPWLPESGLVTGALKIRRPMIEMRYKDDIDRMFKKEHLD